MAMLSRGLLNMRLVNQAQEGLLPKGQTRVVKITVTEVLINISNKPHTNNPLKIGHILNAL